MERLGLLGGMSWESTHAYYAALNHGVKARLGGLHSANLIINSLDFAPVAAWMAAGQWQNVTQVLVTAANELECAGAERLMICTNTMHKLAPEITSQCNLPLLHVGDASGRALQARDATTVGLLGTRFTMQEPFYGDYLAEHYGLSVIVPPDPEQQVLHDIIFEELCAGIFTADSKQRINAMISTLIESGADAILLACTELGLIVDLQEAPFPILDTTLLHVDYALDAIL